MQRPVLSSLAAALVFGATGALAQSGDLSGVTMRVLDDLGEVDVVVLSLDANRSETDEDAADAPADGETTRDADRARETASRDEADEDERRAERRQRDELHDTDVDERSEGRLEDRDVERPAVPAAP
jgi:hypothetical protein